MQAMDTLGRALGEGRLTMDEFDERCTQVQKAQTNADLQPIVADLPVTQPDLAVAAEKAIDYGGEGADKLYSAREIVEARRSGQRMRAGTFLLGSVGSFAAMGLFMELGLSSLGAAFFLAAIPTLFILLYVMKIGPDSWYMPTIRELEKQRRQLIRAKQLELEAAQAYDQAQRKLERKAQIDRLTGDAINMAQETVNRFKPKG